MYDRSSQPAAFATATSGAPSAFLDVREISVQFTTDDGIVKAVDELSFTLERGKTLGIVGESGSGKSATSLALLGLHTGANASVTGEVWFDGTELVGASPRYVRSLRGSRIAMTFQDALSSLHPYYKVGWQIAEAYRAHNDVSGRAARVHATELLRRVGIPDAAKRIDDYPHQFSGGMRQRAMIALALSCNPDLLIADEPTTALDVTVQAQILDLIAALQAEYGSAVILITHDLGVVAEVADEILVMYAGRAMERGTTEDIFEAPQHPYTWGLLNSVTRLDRKRRDRLRPIPGSPPSLIGARPGCPFHERCAYEHLTEGRAATIVPPLRESARAGHFVACHLSDAVRDEIFAREIAPAL